MAEIFLRSRPWSPGSGGRWGRWKAERRGCHPGTQRHRPAREARPRRVWQAACGRGHCPVVRAATSGAATSYSATSCRPAGRDQVAWGAHRWAVRRHGAAPVEPRPAAGRAGRADSCGPLGTRDGRRRGAASIWSKTSQARARREGWPENVLAEIGCRVKLRRADAARAIEGEGLLHLRPLQRVRTP